MVKKLLFGQKQAMEAVIVKYHQPISERWQDSAFGFAGFKGLKTKIDKGHAAQFKLLTERLRNGGKAMIPFADIENVTVASFACLESLVKGEWVGVRPALL